MVTLWSAFLTAKTNVTREAESLMVVYRTAKHLPGSEAFRQAVVNYVKTVIDVEWAEMEKDAMSPEADRRFDDIWARFYELKDDPNKTGELYTNLTEAGRQRSSRATILQGNLYPPVWVILIFGFISVVYGLYFINREPTVVSLIYEFMVIFLVLSCIYFIYDLDTPFSGLITVKPGGFPDRLPEDAELALSVVPRFIMPGNLGCRRGWIELREAAGGSYENYENAPTRITFFKGLKEARDQRL